MTLLGNLTRDVELRQIQSGTSVCDLGLAVNDRVKRGDQWIDEVSFFDVTCWGRTAEIANEYLRKGSPVLISGRLKQGPGEKHGEKRYKVKVICDRLQLLGGKKDVESQSSPRQEPTPQTTGRTYVPDDEVPF